LSKEPGLRGLRCVSQKPVIIEYKGFTREEPLRFDVLMEECLLVEAKAVKKILPIHKAIELHEAVGRSPGTIDQFP
jgi:GxxExxY protein